MKRYFTTVIAFVFAIGLYAQVPELPEILQEKLDQEQLDFTISYDENEQDKSEEQYYRFIERTAGSDTLLGYRWNRDTEEWMLRARIIKNYNDDEQLTEKYFQHYTHDSVWVEGLYFSYAYTDSGEPSEMIIQYWDADSATWVNHFKKTHFYDDAGKLTKIRTQWWSGRHEKWVNHQLKKFAWNGDLLEADTVKVHFPMTDGWTNHHYSAYHYTDAGLKISKVIFTWRHFMEVWKKARRLVYSYNDSGENVIAMTVQKWFGEDAGWKDFHRYNYSYNDDGDLSGLIFEYWNYFHSIWVERKKVNYGYDDAGWMNHIVWQSKHSPDSDWANVKQAFITYDDLGNMTERIEQYWNKHNEEWVNFRKWEMVLQYRSITGIFERPESDVKAIFANPYRNGDEISFKGLEDDIYQLQLFDISGKLIESKEINPNGQASFSSSLHNGMYIMVLSNAHGPVFNTKLMVNR